MDPKTRVFQLQAAEGEDLVILACTAFDWSNSMIDRQTELRWQIRAILVPAVARKNVIFEIIAMCYLFLCYFYSFITLWLRPKCKHRSLL